MKCARAAEGMSAGLHAGGKTCVTQQHVFGSCSDTDSREAEANVTATSPQRLKQETRSPVENIRVHCLALV